MTHPVGSIGIGVSIDASNLSSDLTAAVQRSLKPALGNVQKQVGTLSSSLNHIDTTGVSKLSRTSDTASTHTKTLATNVGQVVNKAKGAKAIDAAATGTEKLGKKSRLAAGKMAVLGGVLDNVKGEIGSYVAGLGGLAVVKSVITTGNNLTRQLNEMAGATGATAEQMAKVSKASRELGAAEDIPATSAAKAAAAMTELAKGGLSVSDSMKAAKGTLQLAAAAGTDAATAATIQANALNTFGKSADFASKAADLLAATANASSAEIGDVALALQSGGAVASQFGISMKDTTAAIGLLSNAGIQGSDAGTLLKTTLLQLAAPSKQASQALDALGVNAFDDQGKFVGLSSIFGQLQAASKSMTPELYAQNTAIALGSDGARLAGIAAREGSKGFEAMETAVDKNGAAMDVANARMKGLPGAWEKFKNSIEEVQLTLYDLIKGPLKGLVDALSGVFGWLGKNQGAFKAAVIAVAALIAAYAGYRIIASATTAMQGVSAAIKGVTLAANVSAGAQRANAAATGLMTVATKAWSVATKTATVVMKAFNLLFVSSPIGLIVVAIAAVVAALVLFFTKTEIGRQIWSSFVSFLTTAWEAIKTAIVGAWNNYIWPALQAFWGFIKNTLWPIITGLWQTVIVPAFQGISAVIGVAWDIIKGIFGLWKAYITNVLVPVILFLWHNVVEPAMHAIGAIISAVWNGVIKPAWAGFKIALDALGTAFSWLWHNIIEPGWRAIGAAISSVYNNIIKPVWDAFKAALKAVGEFFKSTVDGIKSVWNGLKAVLAKPINFMINTVYNGGIKKAWDAIAGFLPGMDPAPALSPIGGYRKGGPIRGPGGIDNVLMWGTAGEHMWTVSDVLKAGGQSLLYAMRAMIQRGVPFTWDGGRLIGSSKTSGHLPVSRVLPYGAAAGPGGNPNPQGLFDPLLPKFEKGGAIFPWMVQLFKGHKFARSLDGQPYTWGNNDCSGYMSKIASVILGTGTGRKWATGSFPGGQPWKRGLGPGFSVGVWNNPGGPGGGHTAGTLSAIPAKGIPRAVNVESGGSHGDVAYGPPAVGADAAIWSGKSPGQFHLGIGANGFFESGGAGGGPSPDEQRGFIENKVLDILNGALAPVRAGITAAIGDRPPEWKHIPHAYLKKAPEIVVDSAKSIIGGLGDALSGVWSKAVSVGSAVTSAVSDTWNSMTSAVGSWFDDGGEAHGKGFIGKNTVKPERVLSPEQTRLFGVLVDTMTEVAHGPPPGPGKTDKLLDQIATNTGVTAKTGKQAASAAAAAPGGPDVGKQIGDAAFGAAKSAVTGISGDVMDAALTTPGLHLKNKPTADMLALAREHNPLALASAMGFNVADFSRFGGGASAQDLMQKTGPQFTARGTMRSDTAALVDRTTTSAQASDAARTKQLLDVLTQVKDKLGKDVLGPVMQAAVSKGIEGLKSSVTQGIGSGLGTAAAPEIAAQTADAVGSAVSQAAAASGGGGGGSALGGAVSGMVAGAGAVLMDDGGIMPHGGISYNLSGSDERVLNPEQTRLFDAGKLGGWAFAPSGQFATTSGVIGNATVGAEWFGVSQIPILSTIVNLIIRVLLKVIGVELKVRDTLNEMTDEFRQFRGNTWRAFTAQGRLLNDTSALIDRSASSEQEAADERIRILKIVIKALVKYIIEKVIVPIAKAVPKAAIQAGSSAASTAIAGTGAGPAGGIVATLINSAGDAGVDIAAEVGTDFALALTDVLTGSITNLIRSLLPDLVTDVFSGGLRNFGGMGAVPGMTAAGGIGALLAAVFGSATFDSGGLARGTGLMPKATIRPERVLSPGMTVAFDRLADALSDGRNVGGNTTIHAPFTVVGGENAGRQAHEQLLELLS